MKTQLSERKEAPSTSKNQNLSEKWNHHVGNRGEDVMFKKQEKFWFFQE